MPSTTREFCSPLSKQSLESAVLFAPRLTLRFQEEVDAFFPRCKIRTAVATALAAALQETCKGSGDQCVYPIPSCADMLAKLDVIKRTAVLKRTIYVLSSQYSHTSHSMKLLFRTLEHFILNPPGCAATSANVKYVGFTLWIPENGACVKSSFFVATIPEDNTGSYRRLQLIDLWTGEELGYTSVSLSEEDSVRNNYCAELRYTTGKTTLAQERRIMGNDLRQKSCVPVDTLCVRMEAGEMILADVKYVSIQTDV